MKKNIFIILFIFIIFNQNILAKELFEPEVPDDIGINISWKALKRYQNFINLIKEEDKDYSFILSKYKKNFKSKVYFKDKNKKLLILPAQARITGDWKDHIDQKKGVTSIKVKVEKGNIGNIVRFRLLLPSARDFKNEIFWSILMGEIGYPVLFQKIVKVNFNGVELDMLFQEIPNKEFIERFGYRESPIIEVDERQMWLNRYREFKCDEIFYISGKVTYSDKNINDCHALKNSNFNWKVDNKSFIKNDTSIKISLNAISGPKLKKKSKLTDTFLEFEDIDKNIILFDEINSKFAEHGIRNYNRKFLYDPIYEKFIPIYYDGNPMNISSSKDEFLNDTNIFEGKNCIIKDEFINKKIKILKRKYTKRTKAKINQKQICVINYVFKSFKINQKNKTNNAARLYQSHQYEKNIEILNKKIKYPNIEFNRNINEASICDFYGECKKLDFKGTKNFLAGNSKSFRFRDIEIIPAISLNEYSNKKAYKIKKIEDFEKYDKSKIIIDKNEILYISGKINNKNLTFIFKDALTSKVVLHHSEIKNSSISVYMNKNKKRIKSSDIYNQNLITGCFTIIDSFIETTSINIENAECEDAINFIRTNGNLKTVEINKSDSDAIDADFSNLTFNKIIINNSQNDCVDFSAGNYTINELITKNCGDKGISVGERAKTYIKNFKSINSTLDFASKDQSILKIEKFDTSKDDKQICGSVYKKKQEFNGATAIIAKEVTCKITIDELSSLTYYN